MKIRSKVCTGIIAAALLALIPAAGASASTSDAPEPDDHPVEVRMGATLEDSVFLGYEDTPPITPFLFDIGDTIACDWAGNADHVVATIEDTYPYTNGSTTIWPGGDVDLACGTNETSGFKHIRARHQNGVPGHPNSWELLKDSASDALGYETSYSWDDFMFDASHDAIFWSHPTPVKQTANQTTCFSADYYIWKDGVPYSQWKANVIVSYTSFEIVTSFLSDYSWVSDCVDNG